MKHFYEHQDDSMRSKLTEHEFEMPQGAWDDMAERLDALNQPSEAETASWSAWFIIGAMLIATTVGLTVYQWQMPFGKGEQPIAEDAVMKEQSFTKEHAQNFNKTEKKSESPLISSNVDETLQQKQESSLPPTPPASTEDETADVAETPQPMVLIEVAEEEGAPQEVIEEQKPEQAPNPDLNPDGQRPADFEHDRPVYTRKTIVTHTFSESTLKWRNNQLPALSPQPAIQRAQARLLRDTPIIVLENPYTISNTKDWEYGLSAGLNTKVYGRNGEFSLAPVLGGFVRKNLDHQFAVQVDLQYKNLRKQSFQNPLGQNKGPESVFLNVVTETNGGAAPTYEERMAEVYEMQQIHMIELPVSLLYQLHLKHQVGMGLKAAYLFGFESGHARIDAMNHKDLGYNSLDLGALASYEYQLNDHFALGIIYSVGFLNLVKQTTAMEAEHTATWGANYNFSANQQTALESSMGNDELMIPIRVTEDEQIFLQTPRNMYNSDLRILLRYIF